MIADPYTVLGLPEDADDEMIQRRYRSLVRVYSPEREPERFESIRAAFEAIADKRKRLALAWFPPPGHALEQLKSTLLEGGPALQPPNREALDAVLLNGLRRQARERC